MTIAIEILNHDNIDILKNIDPDVFDFRSAAVIAQVSLFITLLTWYTSTAKIRSLY